MVGVGEHAFCLFLLLVFHTSTRSMNRGKTNHHDISHSSFMWTLDSFDESTNPICSQDIRLLGGSPVDRAALHSKPFGSASAALETRVSWSVSAARGPTNTASVLGCPPQPPSSLQIRSAVSFRDCSPRGNENREWHLTISSFRVDGGTPSSEKPSNTNQLRTLQYLQLCKLNKPLHTRD